MAKPPDLLGDSLYRILPFHRVVQLFQSHRLHFSHPSTWEDPYETRLRHPMSSRIYAQCWCKKGVSDAMWRIYSSNALGVRIRTTRSRLRKVLTAEKMTSVINFKIKDVRYLQESVLNYEVEAVADELSQKLSFTDASSPLFMKRLAFRHEAEVRAVILCNEPTPVDVRDGVNIHVDPHELISTVLVDPRAPDEFVSAYRHYLQDELGFTGRVQKSGLYAEHDPLEVL